MLGAVLPVGFTNITKMKAQFLNLNSSGVKSKESDYGDINIPCLVMGSEKVNLIVVVATRHAFQTGS